MAWTQEGLHTSHPLQAVFEPGELQAATYKKTSKTVAWVPAGVWRQTGGIA